MLKRVYGLIKTPEFIAKEALHRLRYPWFKSAFSVSESYQQNFEELESSGITILSQFLSSSLLHRAQEEFIKIISNRTGKNPDSFHNTQPFEESDSLLEIAVNHKILGIIAAYFGRNFALSRADALRLLPTSSPPFGSFQWHHDARGKQLHVMVLLRDLESDGQAMRYLKGSHRKWYSYHRGRQNTIFNDDVFSLDSKDVTLVTGKAGTVAIFDSNGLHAGHRNNSYVRDTLTFCYATWRHFMPITISASEFNRLDRAQQKILRNNPKLNLT